MHFLTHALLLLSRLQMLPRWSVPILLFMLASRGRESRKGGQGRPQKGKKYSKANGKLPFSHLPKYTLLGARSLLQRSFLGASGCFVCSLRPLHGCFCGCFRVLCGALWAPFGCFFEVPLENQKHLFSRWKNKSFTENAFFGTSFCPCFYVSRRSASSPPL